MEVAAVVCLDVLFVLLILGLLYSPPTILRRQPGFAVGVPVDWRESQERAERLLRDLLTEEEYRQLNRRGYIDVPSPLKPQRIYRVPRHRGQVKVLEGSVPIMSLCVQSIEPIPDGDAVIMHKLMIEGNEAEYLKIANRFEPTLYGFIAMRPRLRF